MKNTYRNTIVKNAAIVIIISLFSCTGLKAATSPANSLESIEISEEAIKVENWMSDLAEWNLAKLVITEKVETEDDIELEDWMLTADDQKWNLVQIVDEEPEMEVEKWMTNLKKW